MLRRLGKFLAVSCALLVGGVSLPAQASPAQTSTSTTPSTAKPAATPKTTSSKKSSRKHKKSRKTANWKKHGQQKIDAQRTTAIQEALIREHYLTGTASGVWDDATEKAMQRYQGDNGWQNKSTPDARALIKLGLGPDQQHLLNPDSAMTGPTPSSAPPAAPPADPPAGTRP